MEASRRLTKTTQLKYFSKFQFGDEKGLKFFYELLYPSLYYSGLKYIKDDVNVGCIVNEAFLRLWLSREKISDVKEIERFVKKLTKQAYKAYFKTANNRFNRNMLRMDEIENYQDFIFGYDVLDLEEQHVVEYTEDDEYSKRQWNKIEGVIPLLNTEQQLFIGLCLKYSFDYTRIATHVGGVSEYQVAKKIESTLERLKSIITNTQKLNTPLKNNRFRFEGELNEEQSKVLHMRYALQYAFTDIARELNLTQSYIQQVFVSASMKIKKIKIK